MSHDTPCLAEVYLQQTPGCHWMVDRGGVFVRLFGDPTPIFGKSAAELDGKSCTESLRGDAAVIWQSRFRRALAGETEVLRERHGEAAWSVFLFPVTIDGVIHYAGGSAREVTPWASAEQELRYTVLGALRAQEHQSSAVSRFLHDSVGQNLTALGLQLDLVRMDLGADR